MKSRIKSTLILCALCGAALFLAPGASVAVAASKVTTVPVPQGGQPLAARTDAKGTIHLVFNASDGPQYAKSTNGGKGFLKPVPILDRESRKPGLEFTVWDMAVSPDGHVHVALGTNAWKLKLPKEEWGFFYASLKPGATAFSPVRNINRKPSEGFSLAADDKGNVTACWLADKLYANVSHDNGETFEPTVEIDPTFNPCDCCTTSVTYGADGRVAILYREETNNSRDMYLVLWDQAANKSTRTRVSTRLWKIDACPMTYYGIIPDGDGYLAVWPTEGKIYFAHLDANGELKSPAEIKTPGLTGMRTGMFALNGSDGSTLVAWKKDDQLGWQLYDQQSKPVGRAGSVKSAGKGAAGVIDKAGNFVLFR